ncbi:MAG: gliding motility-associated C-terminal domain-containing protein [Bacteroidetes bacterium]|nr:gliding motility-associated C-terminal domain-containing protein [Bacteroidota bacterium]MBS1541272.1 gliding motility-associated C-terminal domain-containing protein [Bacteroidota bacterium]
MKHRVVRFLLFVLFWAVSASQLWATHLRAGDITISRPSCSSRQIIATINVYTRDFPGSVKFGTGGMDVINWGDGTTTIVNPVTNPPIIAYVDNGAVGKVSVTYSHTYSFPGRYTISYNEANRNYGILNISNSVNVPFYIQTQITIDAGVYCDNSPVLSVDPIDEGCIGVKWEHNPGAYDPDGDSLSFSLFVPKSSATYNSDGSYLSAQDVPGYKLPNDCSFYSAAGISCSTANENHNGPPTFSIDPVKGTLTWDAPGEAGEYNVAFVITEWRKLYGRYYPIGFVERDMQIIIKDCNNIRPVLYIPKDTCILAGTTLNAFAYATDPDGSPSGGAKGLGDSVKIQAFSQLFGINPNPATDSLDGNWQPTFTATQQAKVKFKWKTSCDHVREQPYQVVFKATDNGAPPLATFAVWNIKVVAPAPVLVTAILNAPQRSATLTWQTYALQCALANAPGQTNAVSMQIWRKVDTAPFTPTTCITGMPSFLGYTLMATVPIGNLNYVDKALAAGAKYCYRLVAVFPTSTGSANSLVSNEMCIPPLQVTAPIITNVTVDVTSTTNGQVTIKWRSPFGVDKTNFPPPYSFVLKRAEGVSGSLNLTTVNPGKIPDSTYTDTPLNTAQKFYNYRVSAYASNGAFVDSSATASTVGLVLTPSLKQIELNWSAIVPWSNRVSQYPYHRIYRGTSAATTISGLTLIDSVNVNQYGFLYLDSGQYNHTPLVQTQTYWYAVMTRGSYGNPLISAPLKNFSQIASSNPDDKKKPCAPVIVATGIDCSSFALCQTELGLVTNVISWKKPANDTCRKQIKLYNVYGSPSLGQPYVLIGQTSDTVYNHTNLPSYAYCYKVSAVDLAGNESALSAPFCFDNCPYYELPNVFTPNGDKCNDVFSAYSIRTLGENNKTPCTTMTNDQVAVWRTKCARFVQSVTFTVFNRWGREVYNYQSGNENSIYIDWNGKDNAGQELEAGVYYYIANVVFDVVDPKKKNRNIKGWVHLIR